MRLRKYQEEAIQEALSKNNGIVILPTGTGKSLVIAGICKEIKEPILILQPSKEILEQNFEKIKLLTNEDIGIYSASKNKREINRITLATIGSIKDMALFQHFKVLLVDECHYISAKQGRYKELIKSIKFKKIIGFTATPFRTKTNRDGSTSWQFLHQTRPKILKEIIYIYQLKHAFKDKYLSEINYISSKYDLQKLKIKGNDYDEKSIINYNKEIDIYQSIKLIIEKQEHNHYLIFATSLEESKFIVNILKNYNATTISSKNSNNERNDILNKFKSGEINVICNVGVLTTGFDFPALDCIILARPTKSLGLYYQMVGRGLRTFLGKDKTNIYDLCSNQLNFGDLSTYEFLKNENELGLKCSTKWLIEPKNLKKEEEDKSTISFGKYKNCRLSKIPTHYLNWILDNLQLLNLQNIVNHGYR